MYENTTLSHRHEGKATASAQQAQISAPIPDFSKVTPATTTIQGDQSLFGSVLARRALEKAMDTVAGTIERLVNADFRAR
jgi:hypothetical protein